MGDPEQRSGSGVFLISPTSSSSLLIPSGSRAAAAQRRGRSCCWHRADTKRDFPVSQGAQLRCAACGLVWVTDQLAEMQQNLYPLLEAQPAAAAPGDLLEEGRMLHQHHDPHMSCLLLFILLEVSAQTLV